MNWLRFTMMTVLLAPMVGAGAGAQVTIDVAKITCDQLTLYKVTDPQNIALWLSGYYHGQRNDTTLDTLELATYLQNVKDYCNLHPQVTVVQAVETMLKPK
jgi:hypothetical protein